MGSLSEQCMVPKASVRNDALDRSKLYERLPCDKAQPSALAFRHGDCDATEKQVQAYQALPVDLVD